MTTMIPRAARPAAMMLATLLVSAGCAGDVPRIPSTIFNGGLDLAHPSVGALLAGREDKGTGLSCTATLIGERTVLTAAHCVELQGALYSVRLAETNYEVEQFTVHPQYAAYGRHAGAYEVFAHDLAVLRLGAAPEVTPTPIATQAPYAGQAITIVGYGGRPAAVDPPVQEGVKPDANPVSSELERHAATNQIDQLRPEYFTYELDHVEDGNICPGDSGGPTFAMIGGIEAQIGVHSQSNCRGGGGADRRLDLHAAWILQVAGGDVATVPGSGDAPAPGDNGSPSPGDNGVTPGGDPPPPDKGSTPGNDPLPPGDKGSTPGNDPLPPGDKGSTPGGDPPPPGDKGAVPGGDQPPSAGGKPGAPCALPGDCASGKCFYGKGASYCG